MKKGKVKGGGGKDDWGQGYQTQMPSGARQVNEVSKGKDGMHHMKGRGTA